MVAIVENPNYEAEIYQLETNDPVMGGHDGIDNLQAKQLANRTAWLKAQIESGAGSIAAHELTVDPHPQYSTQAELDIAIANALASLGGTRKVGDLFEHSGTTAPAGALVAPIAATNVSRVAYPALHALYASQGYPWGAGDGATTFGIPWFPANYASVQANGNVGTSTVGENLAHTHAANFTGVINGNTAAIYPQVLIPLGFDAGPNVSIQGGAANLAAGVRVLKCVQYI